MASARFVCSWIQLRAQRAWDAGNFRATQERRLRKLVAFARRRSPFYRARLPQPHPGLTVEELPVTTRDEIDRHFNEVLTVRDLDRAMCEEVLRDPERCGQLVRGKYFIVRTSGTRGRRMPVVYTAAEIDRTVASAVCRFRVLGWAALRVRSLASVSAELLRRLRVAVVIMTDPPLSQYAVARRFSQIAMLVSRCRFFSVTAPFGSVLDAMAEFRPDVIISYPSFLHRLALAKESGRLTLTPRHPLSTIFSVAEQLPPQVERMLERAFGVPVMNYYGLAECLCVAVPCPLGEGLHINEDTCVVECVDEHLRPVAPGACSGKVLLTNLTNLSQPFIRYEVDDSVTVAPGKCRCGSPFRLVRQVTGKVMTTFWIGDGARARALDARVILGAMEQTPGVCDFQAVQTAPRRIEVRVVCSANGEDVLAAAAQNLEKRLGLANLAGAVQIVPVRVQALEADGSSGKVKRFVPLAALGTSVTGPMSNAEPEA